MKKGLKAKWILALISGKYQQTKETLRNQDGYCCLGVLADVSKCGVWDNHDDDGTWQTHYQYHTSHKGEDGFNKNLLSKPLLRDLGLADEEQQFLSKQNDDGEDFETIADWIIENI
tara:strand:+ start:240 stop:587 length:348 start_codon:yes stop_codon:yes gene_type:complete